MTAAAPPMDQTLKDLNLTSEEVNKFEKAFKDPEFLKLFAQYAEEVSDPATKAETDAYLRQLEAQGRAEEVYGKGVTLVTPTEAFVVKSKLTAAGAAAGEGAAGRKVFINVCTSDKVAPVSVRDARDASGKAGKHVDLPLTLGRKKEGKDKRGEPCSVYDFVVHPESAVFAHTNQATMKLLVETAMEHIESMDKVKLVRAFKLLNSKYKATEGCPKPQVLSYRSGEGGESVDGRLRPRNVPPVPDLPGGAAPSAHAQQAQQQAPAANGSAGADAALARAEAAVAAASRSGFAFPKPKAKQPTAAAQPQDPTTAGYRHPGGEVTPAWELVHRGLLDMAEAWGDAGRGLRMDSLSHPKELVLRVQLPDMTSAAAVNLDVAARRVQLSVPHKYRLDVPLPYAVDDAKGRAKFDKAKRQLDVTLPVLPPPMPRRQPVPAATADDDRAAGEAPADVVSAPGPAHDVPPSASAGEVADQGRSEGADAATSRGLTVQPPASLVGAAADAGAEAAPVPAMADAAGAAQRHSSHTGAGPQQEPAAGAGPAAAVADGASSVVPSGAEQQQQYLTENQRRWLELHAQPAHAPQEADAACDGNTSQRDCLGPAPEAAAVGGAAADAPAGGGDAGAAATVKAPPPAVAMLRPRIHHALVHELD